MSETELEKYFSEKYQDMASQVFEKEDTREKFEKAMLDVVYNALRHAKPSLGSE